MKPAWDQLMKTFEGHDDFLVADVDCTAAGKKLCSKNGVRGYPTIKYGDPADLQLYSGGRDFATLQAFSKKVKARELSVVKPPAGKGSRPLVGKKGKKGTWPPAGRGKAGKWGPAGSGKGPPAKGTPETPEETAAAGAAEVKASTGQAWPSQGQKRGPEKKQSLLPRKEAPKRGRRTGTRDKKVPEGGWAAWGSKLNKRRPAPEHLARAHHRKMRAHGKGKKGKFKGKKGKALPGTLPKLDAEL